MTTSIQLPRSFATNTDYATGPDVGTPTKVDPSSDADGFIKGVVAAPQHVNYMLSAQSAVGRRAFQLAALRLREVRREGVTPTDTAESMAAAQVDPTKFIIVIKTAEAFGISDGGPFAALGVPASITSLVADAASNGTRIVAVGTGGNRTTYSDDDGSTWSAGGNLSSTGRRVVWNDFANVFVAAHLTSAVSRSGNGTTWIIDGASLVDPDGGLAVLSNGVTIGLSSTTPGTIRRSPNGTGFSSVGSVPDVGDLDENGSVAGNNGDTVYHVARFSAGTELQVSYSVDGTTFTVSATLSPPGTATFASRPRLMMCQNTGLLVIVAPLSSGKAALYASLDGVDWVGPDIINDPGVDAFACAGGRLLATFNSQLFAADGIGQF